jgi:hypothetical protein
MAGKVRQKKCGRKIAVGKVLQKNRNRKSATEKPLQKKCGSGFVETKLRQQNATRRKKKGMVLICVLLYL